MELTKTGSFDVQHGECFNSSVINSDIYRVSPSKISPWDTTAKSETSTNDDIKINYGNGMERVDKEDLEKAVRYVFVQKGSNTLDGGKEK